MTQDQIDKLIAEHSIDLRKWAFEQWVKLHGEHAIHAFSYNSFSDIDRIFQYALYGNDRRINTLLKALHSNNPTISAAVEALEVLVRLDEGTK